MAANDDFSLLDDAQTPSATRVRSQSKNAVDSSQTMSRDDTLRQELANVRKVNASIEAVLKSLEKTQSNMKTLNTTTGAASQLLNTWTRILSQTEHNQRLILDPSWQGANQDIADIEEEAQAKQNAADRAEAEEQERKATAARKAEDDERRRAEAASRGTKLSARGRGRVVSRGAAGASSTNTGNTSLLRQPSASKRGTSGIGRARGLRGKS